MMKTVRLTKSEVAERVRESTEAYEAVEAWARAKAEGMLPDSVISECLIDRLNAVYAFHDTTPVEVEVGDGHDGDGPWEAA